MQNARQNYVEIVSLVMGAMCCQPAETYGTLSSRQFRYTLPLGKMPDLVSVTPSQLVLAPNIGSTTQASGGEIDWGRVQK